MARRRRGVHLALAGTVLLLVTVSFWPVRSRVGVDYVVTERRLPLWRKFAEFVGRDRHTRQLARSVGSWARSDEQLALAVLNWTNARVRPHPPNVAVVDDHIWSIVDRGYGSNDQQADAFTTLLTYAGVRAYWVLVGCDRPVYPLSLALIDGRWRVFDVERSIVFRNARGELATPEEIAGDAEIVRASATGHVSDVEAYVRHLAAFQPPRPPPVLRAEMQMPGRRATYEFRKLLRLSHDAGGVVAGAK